MPIPYTTGPIGGLYVPSCKPQPTALSSLRSHTVITRIQWNDDTSCHLSMPWEAGVILRMNWDRFGNTFQSLKVCQLFHGRLLALKQTIGTGINAVGWPHRRLLPAFLTHLATGPAQRRYKTYIQHIYNLLYRRHSFEVTYCKEIDLQSESIL